ncbi:MAG: hydrogenase expression/formation protein HypE [Thermodesulfobacteriota bacterium]
MSERILLGHGSGGRLMHRLIGELFARAFAMDELGDAARLPAIAGGLAFTTDSYVVSPRFFPGGNIGELAVFGTVNDLAVAGAQPLFLSAGFIIEEGLPLAELTAVVEAMAAAARRAGVRIVTGDTKVVAKGQADGLFINTAGVGRLLAGLTIDPARIRPGDQVLVSGPIASHGMAIMARRHGIAQEPPLLSDTRPLHALVAALAELGPAVRFLRDPTRGGLATTLKEAAMASGCAIRLEEGALPVLPAAQGVAELLGIDPLYAANEGILVAVVAAEAGERALAVMAGREDAPAPGRIGEVLAAPAGMVLLATAIGGSRIVDMLPGEELPRIC